MKTVCVSGGFDQVHRGHIRMIIAAAKFGNVVVILNSDDWLRRKKGYVALPWDHRAEIMGIVPGVVDVVKVDDSDGTVCEALRRIRPDIFANGGDRTAFNTPELALCEELGIEMLFHVGGDKIESSSEIADAIRKA